jgi:hypothetical protein
VSYGNRKVTILANADSLAGKTVVLRRAADGVGWELILPDTEEPFARAVSQRALSDFALDRGARVTQLPNEAWSYRKDDV